MAHLKTTPSSDPPPPPRVTLDKYAEVASYFTSLRLSIRLLRHSAHLLFM